MKLKTLKIYTFCPFEEGFWHTFVVYNKQEVFFYDLIQKAYNYFEEKNTICNRKIKIY